MMAQPGLRLRHLVFTGQFREPASLKFGPGLNVLYGASDSGKSFVVEAIDFMLGGKTLLRDIPERIGYDNILLGLETLSGEKFTITRSAEGGAFRIFDGLHLEKPTTEGSELSDTHSEKNPNNLSTFLLQRCALDGKRLRKNKYGETISLSFRNLARLMIVTETEILDQRSPLSDGNPTADTPNFATLKLLLTGTDDSSLIATKPKGQEATSREAQLALLDQLIEEYRERLAEIATHPADLPEQLQRLDGTLSQHEKQLATSESQYRDLARHRRDVRNRLEQSQERLSEIAGLLQRFHLLDQHYVSDLRRLRGIEEGGTLFQTLGQAPCPLCGAAAAHHRLDSGCDGNMEAVISAARSEIAKIELLRTELGDTVKSLEREARTFDKHIPKLQSELSLVSRSIDDSIAPQLTRLRTTYGQLANKRGEIKEALAIHKSITDAQRRRENIMADSGSTESSISTGDLPSAIAESFAQQVESVLRAWHFPGAERVFFDAKSRDLLIAGKSRAARGKGLRAITHAAFTVGLLQFCKARETPHPSFVVLDTPLRSYREPEGPEDDLTGTDVNVKFYEYLSSLSEDRQVLVVENTDPPVEITRRPNVTMFTGNPHSGRYGFFPLILNP
jgi:hypothetical protein